MEQNFIIRFYKDDECLDTVTRKSSDIEDLKAKIKKDLLSMFHFEVTGTMYATVHVINQDGILEELPQHKVNMR